MPKINPDYYLDTSKPKSTPSPELGQDAFLKILIAQIQNQDPMSPMEDKEFIAQMATFSQLEQTMKMNASLELLLESQMVSPVVKYSHMIDKEVTYENKKGEIKQAKVVAVTQRDGWAILELDNKDEVIADAVIKIGNTIEKEEPNEDDSKIDEED